MVKRTQYFGNLGHAFRNFPVAHILLGFLTVLMWMQIAHDFGSFEEEWKLLLSGILALLLSVVVSVYVLHQSPCKKPFCFAFWGGQVVALLLGAGFYFTLQEPHSYASGLSQFGFFLLAVLLIFLVIARLLKKNEQKIWFSWTSFLEALSF